MIQKSVEQNIYYFDNEDKTIKRSSESITKTLSYIADMAAGTQNYIEDIRILVQQAYLEGKLRIHKEQIKQKFINLSLRELSYIMVIAKKIMTILPSEKINFKGRFQHIIYKIAVIKEIFDYIQKYLQHQISLENAIRFIADVSGKVRINMDLKDSKFEQQKQIEVFEFQEEVLER